jgi:hypothetical protein
MGCCAECDSGSTTGCSGGCGQAPAPAPCCRVCGSVGGCLDGCPAQGLPGLGALASECISGCSGGYGSNSFRQGWICGGDCGGNCSQCCRVKRACGCGSCQSCRAARDMVVDATGAVMVDPWGNPLRSTTLDARVGTGARVALKKPESRRIGVGSISVTTSGMSVVGAGLGGLLGWWLGGRLAHDQAGQIVGAASGAMVGLVLF